MHCSLQTVKMKVMYLCESLPETKVTTKTLPADIQRKLEAYHGNKTDLANRAPDVRPLPLERYNVDKVNSGNGSDEAPRRTVHIAPAEEGVGSPLDPAAAASSSHQEAAADEASVLLQLPKSVQSKARRLLPHLKRLEIIKGSESGDFQKNLLYDLTVAYTQNLRSDSKEVVLSALRQLLADPTVNKRLFVQKLPLTHMANKNSAQHSLTTGHPAHARERKTLPYRRYSYSSTLGWM